MSQNQFSLLIDIADVSRLEMIIEAIREVLDRLEVPDEAS